MCCLCVGLEWIAVVAKHGLNHRWFGRQETPMFFRGEIPLGCPVGSAGINGVIIYIYISPPIAYENE